MDKYGFKRLHKSPRKCRRGYSARNVYLYQKSRQRWLERQDGYKIEQDMSEALMSGEIGRVEAFRIIES